MQGHHQRGHRGATDKTFPMMSSHKCHTLCPCISHWDTSWLFHNAIIAWGHHWGSPQLAADDDVSKKAILTTIITDYHCINKEVIVILADLSVEEV